MKLPFLNIYITRTDWESAYNQTIKAMNNPTDELGMIYKGDKYQQDDSGNWRNKLGQYVSPREVMTEQLRIERDHKKACDAYSKPVQWDKVKQL